MRWKLSYIERIIDVNITCFVRLEGSFDVNQVRSALSRVQRKHPVLRALVRDGHDGPYYEADCAPEIPLRILARVSEHDYRQECQSELTTAFPPGQPQLRAVWLQSEWESDLLLTTTHRICDGMSVFTIVREVLCGLQNAGELIPYEPVTVHDIIGNYRPLKPWKHKLAVLLMNGVLRLIPTSRRPPENNEHHLEWGAGPALSAALKQRCKTEGVSVHALLVVALERALFLTFGRKLPKTIVSPIDLRRGRFTALKSDTVFFGGGDIKLRACHSQEVDFWTRARVVHEEIRRELDREIRDVPARFHFLEQIRPLSSGQIRWIMRLGDALKSNRSRFGLANLGNVATSGRDVPLGVKDMRLYGHSFSFRTFGLVPYTVNGDMRFYFSIDGKCMGRSEAEKLQREFIQVLHNQGFSMTGQEADTVSRESRPFPNTRSPSRMPLTNRSDLNPI
jgi:hypothetical protein